MIRHESLGCTILAGLQGPSPPVTLARHGRVSPTLAGSLLPGCSARGGRTPAQVTHADHHVVIVSRVQVEAGTRCAEHWPCPVRCWRHVRSSDASSRTSAFSSTAPRASACDDPARSAACCTLCYDVTCWCSCSGDKRSRPQRPLTMAHVRPACRGVRCSNTSPCQLLGSRGKAAAAPFAARTGLHASHQVCFEAPQK